MIKYFILVLWLCLVVIDTSPVAASEIREVLDLQSECARIDFGDYMELRKHYVALLILVSNLEEDQSAVVLVVCQVLEAVSAMHCQERNEINNHRREIRA